MTDRVVEHSSPAVDLCGVVSGSLTLIKVLLVLPLLFAISTSSLSLAAWLAGC
jgi:hypothetical protein